MEILCNLEFEILHCLQALHTPLLDKIMVFITSISNHGEIWILLAVIFLCVKKTRKIGIGMLLSILIGFLIGNIWLKNIFARQRPCWIDPSVRLLIPVPGDYSFPSGHSMIAFEGAVSIWLYNRKFGIWSLVFAVLTAFSRLYLFVHFPTDVLAGALMGTVIAWLVYKLMKKHLQSHTDMLYFKKKIKTK